MLTQRQATRIPIICNQIFMCRVHRKLLGTFEEATSLATAFCSGHSWCLLLVFQRRPSIGTFEIFAAKFITAKLVVGGYITGIRLVRSKTCAAGVQGTGPIAAFVITVAF